MSIQLQLAAKLAATKKANTELAARVAEVQEEFGTPARSAFLAETRLRKRIITALREWFDTENPEGYEVCIGAPGHYTNRPFDSFDIYYGDEGMELDNAEADHPYDRSSISVTYSELEKYFKIT